MVFPGRIFEHLLREHFTALEACRHRLRKKSLHRLRTSARRLEALLGVLKRRGRGDAKLGRKIDKALKALQPVRAAAGPVRDVDVQRELLAGLWDSGKLESEGGALAAEAHKVQANLKKRRKEAGTKLAFVVGAAEGVERKRLSPLRRMISGIQWKSLMKQAHSIERRCVKDLDPADPESLHLYRKRMKLARYLAEMEDSAAAERFAEGLKKVLDAIGRWHDWRLLAQLAKETLGKSSALADVLKKERAGALRRVVRLLETRP